HSIIHRLEQDPEPQSLRGMRSQGEAKQVITRRLDHLWSECGLEPSPDDIAPFPSGFLDRVAGRSSRAILLECLEHRQRCVQAGKLVELTSTVPSGGSDPEPSSVIDTTQLSQAWNDRLTSPH